MAKQLRQLQCQICGHQWYPQRPQLPKVCPRCKTYKWEQKKIK